MAKVIKKVMSEKSLVSPKGYALWVKVGKRVDEYEGKKKLVVNMYFDDATEAKMKKLCDKFLSDAKKSEEFKGKNWRPSNDRCGYEIRNIKVDGEEQEKALFKFWTGATVTDPDTGDVRKKVVPIYSVERKKKINPYEVEIGNGSEIRVAFRPEAYWTSRDSNGVSLYLNKMVVDKLVEYNGDSSFDEFGIKMDEDENEGFNSVEDEDIPF